MIWQEKFERVVFHFNVASINDDVNILSYKIKTKESAYLQLLATVLPLLVPLALPLLSLADLLDHKLPFKIVFNALRVSAVAA